MNVKTSRRITSNAFVNLRDKIMNKIPVSVAALCLVLVLGCGPDEDTSTTIQFTDFQADMTSVIDPASGNETISLLINSTMFGAGGFAGGQGEVGGNPADDTVWLVDPFGGAPPDGTPVIRVLLDTSGDVLGIDPTPFQVYVAYPPDPIVPPDPVQPAAVIGELDFSEVSGTGGSLSLSGIVVHVVDQNGKQTGEAYSVNSFTLIDATP
jgi:hypothetical protein